MHKKSMHEHGAGGSYKTMPEGQKASRLMEGIVSGIPKKTMPPTIDGIVRGVEKHKATNKVMHIKEGATPHESNTFGSGIFPSGF